jgi:hypothetical protein
VIPESLKPRKIEIGGDNVQLLQAEAA